MRCAAFAFLVLLGAGCASYEAVFDVHLVEVAAAPPGAGGSASREIRRLGDGGRNVFIFEDEVISVFWMPRATRFEFKLANKAGETIRVLWDEAAYVDEKGESRRLVHGGTEPRDRNRAQPPSTVVRGGAIGDFLLPADRLETRGVFRTRHEGALLAAPSANREGLKAKAQTFVGKRVKVLLPLQRAGALKEYLFTFEIRGFRIE